VPARVIKSSKEKTPFFWHIKLFQKLVGFGKKK